MRPAMIGRAGRHVSQHVYAGVGLKEWLLSLGLVAMVGASGFLAGAVLGEQTQPLDGLIPTTLTVLPASSVASSTSRPGPPGGPGAPQSAPGGSGPTPITQRPPDSEPDNQVPPTTAGAPTPATTTTAGSPPTTCKAVVVKTTPHITIRVCHPRR